MSEKARLASSQHHELQSKLMQLLVQIEEKMQSIVPTCEAGASQHLTSTMRAVLGAPIIIQQTHVMTECLLMKA